MDFVWHQVTNRSINEPVPLQRRHPGKTISDDQHGEMTGAAGSGVSGMLVRIIDNIELCRRQGLSEPFPD